LGYATPHRSSYTSLSSKLDFLTSKTTKPACKMKIRHSLTPAQQAAFYRTLKEGMVKVEQALIL